MWLGYWGPSWELPEGAQWLLLLDLEPGVASEAPRTESAILDVLELGSTANREPGQQSGSLWVLKNPAVGYRDVCEGPELPPSNTSIWVRVSRLEYDWGDWL